MPCSKIVHSYIAQTEKHEHDNVCPQYCMAINSNICLQLFTFARMTTGAFSRNVGKLFSELKLVTDNLLFTNAVLSGECNLFVGCYIHLHPFHFVLFKFNFKDLVAKQHPTSATNVHTAHLHTQQKLAQGLPDK